MDLRARFLALWSRCGAKGNPLIVWQQIEESYRWTGRHYHTLVHVEDLLKKLDDFFQAAPDQRSKRDILEWAIFFHDFIYNIGRDVSAGDNEEESAGLAQIAILRAGLGQEFREEVASLILATRHEGEGSPTYLQQVMIDLDLSILGAEKDVFDSYERNVYREYVEHGKVEREAFRRGRKKILEGFLARRPLFSIAFFFQRYEDKAKENLSRSIAALS